MNELARSTLRVARAAQRIASQVNAAPEEGRPSETQHVIPMAVVRRTRGYIESTANQINGTYEKGYYDACAVMLRRLVETLIIEVYEHLGIECQIKDGSGNYLKLSELIDRILNEPALNLTRNSKTGLPKLKWLGDLSAHNPTFCACRQDLDNVIPSLRVVVQELVHKAGLK